MHKSRLGGIVIDCDTDDVDGVAAFWSQALGYPATPSDDPAEVNYVTLKVPDNELGVEVQKVDHPSRVHIDTSNWLVWGSSRSVQARFRWHTTTGTSWAFSRRCL